MVDAIITEIHQRHHELTDKNLQSIYFGGGTPSLLSGQDLEKIVTALSTHFHWSQQTEITLEANPDDLDSEKLDIFRSIGINRLSIGIQSFSDETLQYMNRAHSSQEAVKCLDLAHQKGYDNITVDLIYGCPGTSDHQWKDEVQRVIDFGIPHISAYCLTVEEGTALAHFIKVGKTTPVDSDKSIRHFELLMDITADNGYTHYEISNFAKARKYAVHNTNYWKSKPYLGIGPGAHSFDGKLTRRWNIAHNPKYITGVTSGKTYWESESLSLDDRYNEYILTGLRTMWGIDTSTLETTYAVQWKTMQPTLHELLEEGLVNRSNDTILLTRHGKLLADHVSMRLFMG